MASNAGERKLTEERNTIIDFPKWIKEEHQKAELLRLEQGWTGCGCSDCQEFYKTIDLKKYGDRVKEIADIILISGNRKLEPKIKGEE